MRAPAPSLRPTTGAPTFDREVHHLVDLLGEDLAERAAEHGEVLGEEEHLAPGDRPPSGDHAVGVRPLLEPGGLGSVPGQLVELVEAAGVEQVVDPLAGEHLALRVLAFDRPWRPGGECCLTTRPKIGELVVHR